MLTARQRLSRRFAGVRCHSAWPGRFFFERMTGVGGAGADLHRPRTGIASGADLHRVRTGLASGTNMASAWFTGVRARRGGDGARAGVPGAAARETSGVTSGGATGTSSSESGGSIGRTVPGASSARRDVGAGRLGAGGQARAVPGGRLGAGAHVRAVFCMMFDNIRMWLDLTRGRFYYEFKCRGGCY